LALYATNAFDFHPRAKSNSTLENWSNASLQKTRERKTISKISAAAAACVITIYQNQTFVLTRTNRNHYICLRAFSKQVRSTVASKLRTPNRELRNVRNVDLPASCPSFFRTMHDLSFVSSSGCPQLKCTDSSQKQLGVYFVDTASAPRPQMARKPMKAPLFGALEHL